MTNKVKVIAVIDSETFARRLRKQSDWALRSDTMAETLDTAVPAIKDPALRRALNLPTIH